jgi:4-amino-4-deoxy-L-arabinose transferase-like glycosyltransferase
MHAHAPTQDEFRERRVDTALLLLIAAAFLILHVAVGGRYGFQRDELATLEDARHLAAGYVAYPPITPFFGRISLDLFGTSLRGFRFFAALAQAIIAVLAGLMARELGGKRFAQVVAALAVAISPVSLASGTLMQYVAFDFLFWVLTAYLIIRLLRTGNPLLWLPIGAAIGLGMLSKYTMLFFVASIVVSLLLTDARKYLASRWLWLGVVISLLIFLPNLLWQVHHNFISLDMLHHIHARDIRIGRTKNFLPEQLGIPANIFTIPLWIAGLFFYFRAAQGRRFRMLGWMFIITFLIFLAAKGRSYYMAPAYPMLLAAGAVLEESWLQSMAARNAGLMRGITFAALAIGGVIAAAVTLPLAPVNSHWWQVADKIDSDFREEIGWPELVSEVARIYNSMPPSERIHTGILAANYGEAGAINLYGPAYGLPRAISGVNSFWAYGYPSPPPTALIVLGMGDEYRNQYFQSCEIVGQVTNAFGISNEETDRPNIYLCREMRQSWPDFWHDFRYFG